MSKIVFNSGAINSLQNSFDNRAHLMAYSMAKEIRGRVPVLTGNLKSSVETVKVQDGYDVIAGENGYLYGHASYAMKQELYNPRKPHFFKNTFLDTFSGSWEVKYFGGMVK